MVQFRKISASRFEKIQSSVNKRATLVVSAPGSSVSTYAIQDSLGLLYAFEEYNKDSGEVFYFERVL